MTEAYLSNHLSIQLEQVSQLVATTILWKDFFAAVHMPLCIYLYGRPQLGLMHSMGAASCPSQKLRLQLEAECVELAASWEAGRGLSITCAASSPHPQSLTQALCHAHVPGWTEAAEMMATLALSHRLTDKADVVVQASPSAVGSNSKAAVARMQMSKEVSKEASCN